MKKTLYLAKEPGKGVRDDLSRLSKDQVVVVDCNGYGDWYRKKGYNVISKVKYFELDGTMRFDDVIGNPPYAHPNNPAKNNKLWHKFVDQALKLVKPGGSIKLVTPSSIIGETGFGKKMLKLFSTSYNMVSIDYTADKYFSVGVDICRWHVINEPYKGETKVVDKDGISYHDLTKGMPLTGDKLIEHSILNKIATSNHSRIPLKIGQSIAKDDYVDDGKFAVYSSGQTVRHTNIVPNTPDCLKFVVSFSSSYKERFTTTGHIGMLNMWCSIESEDEGNHLKAIVDHPLMRFYIERYKKTSGFTPAVKNAMLPMLESVENIHEQFDLSPEEVEYLKNNNHV
jgi:hypothetical protein